MTTGSISYKEHLLPRLRESTDDAGGYIAANLKDNADSLETIALAFRDVIQAYELPIEVSTGERARLERLVIEAAKKWAELRFQPHFGGMIDLEDKLQRATKTLIDFESKQEK